MAILHKIITIHMPPIDSRLTSLTYRLMYATYTRDSKTDALNLSIDKAIITNNSPLINTSVA